MPARFKRFQNSFLGGEIDPEFIMRGDAESANQSCRMARNVALLTGGGAVRRAGSRLKQKITAKRRLHFFYNSAGTLYCLGIENAQARIMDGSTGALLASIAAPWATGDIDTLSVVNANGGVYVASNSFAPQFLSYENSTLAIAGISYSLGVLGISQQPFFRYAAKGITLTPSALGGSSITVTFSSAVLTAQHVGVKFRIAGRELTITAVSSATVGTATANQQLYPTYDVPVLTSGGFAEGQIVEGSDTKFRGEVVNIPDATTLTILMLNSYQSFYYDSGNPTLSEKIIGPSGQTRVDGSSSAATPAPALEWDEQMISPARGYPGAIAVHRNRLIMAGFPNARPYIAASAVGQYVNFDTRQYDVIDIAASDAFIEGIGIDEVEIQHLASLENLMVLTDGGVFYVPEFEVDFAPGQIKFFKLGPEAASACPPVVVTEGLIYADISGGKIMAIIPTGLVARPWEVRELSQAASHLVRSPIGIFAASSVAARRHRMIFVLNSDGTIATLAYQRFENFAGWTLWSRETASCVSIAINDSKVWLLWQRGSDYAICEADWSLTLDETIDYSAAATSHASTAVTLAWSGHYAGRYTLDGSGLISDVTPASGLAVGFDYDVELEPFPPFDAERGRNPVGIPTLYCHVYQSGAFKVEGEYWSPYRPQDSLFEPPPAFTGDVEFHLYDEYSDSFLRAPRIMQDECAPLHVQAITMEGRF